MWFLTARSYDGLLLIRLSNIFFREHPDVLGEDILLLIEHLGVLLRTHSIIFCSDILVLWKIYWNPIGMTIWLFWGDFVVFFLLPLLVFYAEYLLVFFAINFLSSMKSPFCFHGKTFQRKTFGSSVGSLSVLLLKYLLIFYKFFNEKNLLW